MPNTARPYSFAQLESLWIQAGGDRASAAIMAAIALAESSGIPTNSNKNKDGSIDRGLWQINSSNVDSASMYDPMANAKEAVKLKNSGQGLRNWTTYNNGAYRQYMSSASPDPNLPGGSTSTATQASLSGDIGDAIGSGFASAFKAMFEPIISTVIWTGEITMGIGLMVLAVVVFIMSTDAGKRATGAVLSAAGTAASAAGPEVGIPVQLATRRGRQRAIATQARQTARKSQRGQRVAAQREAERQQRRKEQRGKRKPGNSKSESNS